jgi:hypothetical protein
VNKLFPSNTCWLFTAQLSTQDMLVLKTNEVVQYFKTGAYRVAVDVAGVDGYIFFISWVWLMVIEPR